MQHNLRNQTIGVQLPNDEVHTQENPNCCKEEATGQKADPYRTWSAIRRSEHHRCSTHRNQNRHHSGAEERSSYGDFSQR